MSQHEAGRELDALVAEKVMGWHYADRQKMGWGDGPPVVVTDLGEESGRPTIQGWSPSTDIAAAFQVVEKMRERGLTVVIDGTPGGFWCCEFSIFGSETFHTGRADSLPLAICLASLAAIESESRASTPEETPRHEASE